MKRRVLHGEANSVNKVALRKGEVKSLNIFSGYHPKNIFNCDEAGLVFKQLNIFDWKQRDQSPWCSKGQKTLQ